MMPKIAHGLRYRGGFNNGQGHSSTRLTRRSWQLLKLFTNKSVGKVSIMAEITLGLSYKRGFGDGQSHLLTRLVGGFNNC